MIKVDNDCAHLYAADIHSFLLIIMDILLDNNDQRDTRRKRVRRYFIGIYDVTRFVGSFFRQALYPPYEFKEIVKQAYEVGCKSLPIITLTAFITGIVFTKQSRPSLSEFGATSWLPSLISIAIIRALAPLITALVIAGKVGSNMGAELGSMRVTEQIDAMEVTAAHPMKFLVTTRVLAITLMLPVLVIFFGCIGLMGAYLNVHANEQTSFISFTQDAFTQISFLDLFSSLLKSIAYGFTIGIAGCYNGYNATKGTVGVGRAANSAVVVSMFLIFIEEMIIVQIINYLR